MVMMFFGPRRSLVSALGPSAASCPQSVCTGSRRAVLHVCPMPCLQSRPQNVHRRPGVARSVAVASRRPRNAHVAAAEPAEAVEEEEATGVIMDNPSSRVDLERLFEMSSQDFRTSPVSYESLLADVDKLGLETEAFSSESDHMRHIRDEVAELTRSLDALSVPNRAPTQQRANRPSRRPTRKRTTAKAVSAGTDGLLGDGLLLNHGTLVMPERSGEVSTSGRPALISRTDRTQTWGRTARDVLPSKKRRRSTKKTNSNQMDLIKTAKVMSAAEEHSLACKVQKYNIIKGKFDSFAEDLEREPTIREFAVHLGSSNPDALAAFMARGVGYREAFYAANVRLVVSIARKMHPPNKGIELADLVAEGLKGLNKGIDRFDPHKGFKFSTYAHWWIRQAIMFVLNEQVTVVRFPPSMRANARRVLTVRTEFAEKHGRQPTHEELSAEAGVTPRRLTELMRLYAQFTSIDKAVSGDPNADTLADLIEDPDSEGQELKELASDAVMKDIEAVLHTLTHREAAIVRLRFGLPHNGEPCRKATLQEVGQLYSVTKERVRQIEGKALHKLRVISEQLDSYTVPEESEMASRSNAMYSKSG